jgi:hypothetical protein
MAEVCPIVLTSMLLFRVCRWMLRVLHSILRHDSSQHSPVQQQAAAVAAQCWQGLVLQHSSWRCIVSCVLACTPDVQGLLQQLQGCIAQAAATAPGLDRLCEVLTALRGYSGSCEEAVQQMASARCARSWSRMLSLLCFWHGHALCSCRSASCILSTFILSASITSSFIIHRLPCFTQASKHTSTAGLTPSRFFAGCSCLPLWQTPVAKPAKQSCCHPCCCCSGCWVAGQTTAQYWQTQQHRHLGQTTLIVSGQTAGTCSSSATKPGGVVGRVRCLAWCAFMDAASASLHNSHSPGF